MEGQAAGAAAAVVDAGGHNGVTRGRLVSVLHSIGNMLLEVVESGKFVRGLKVECRYSIG